MSATSEIATWIAGRHEPAEVSHRASELVSISLIDTLACALAGTVAPAPRILAGLRPRSDGPSATMIRMGRSAHPTDAALVNGMLAHMLDYDDGDFLSRGHPSCVLVPALLAMSETLKASGKQFIDAYLVGYAVIQLLGTVCRPSLVERGYHVTSAIGVLGATAALARLSELSSTQTAIALGIAATTASGLRVNFGSDMKPFHAGRAASAAVDSVLMAKAGITASLTAIEGLDGFLSVLWGIRDADRLDAEVARLVSGGYSIENEPPMIKLHSCCGATHAIIDAILDLRSPFTGDLPDVSEIIAEAPSMAQAYLTHSRPTSGLEAKFSMEACAAIAWIDGAAGNEQFSDESVKRDKVQTLLRKVKFGTSKDLDRMFSSNLMPGRVTIISGINKYSREIKDARGFRSNPCDIRDVSSKFIACSYGVIGDNSKHTLLNMLTNIDTQNDMGSIMRFLV